MFDGLKKAYDLEIAANPRTPIQITLPDSRIMHGQAWETTPMDIAKMLSKSLSERVVISKVGFRSLPTALSSDPTQVTYPVACHLPG